MSRSADRLRITQARRILVSIVMLSASGITWAQSPVPPRTVAADPYGLTPPGSPYATTSVNAVAVGVPAEAETMPIDLSTALRLADIQNPTNGRAQARIRQALAQLDQANVLLLPNLTAGANYFRHDGIDQNRRGDIFSLSRSNNLNGGSVQLRVDLADAIYLPLVARRITDAAAANAEATRNNIQLETASAYLDLLEVYARIAINADTLGRAEQMLDRAKAADAAGLSKTQGDVNRAATEVNLRRQERLDLQGRVGAVSSRLGRVLLLQSTIDLRPIDPTIVPIQLVPGQPFENLVGLAMANRPELAETRSLLGASEERLRLAKNQPLIPKVQVGYTSGAFAGARNGNYSQYDSQGEFNAQLMWEFRNLGFGNRASVRLQQAALDDSAFRQVEVQAIVRAEVLEAAKLATARFKTLDAAQEAVRQATELYRKLLESSFGMVGPKAQYDALEPLLAIQALNQARIQYLTEVIEFNRLQFRLYTALGQPAVCSLPSAATIPVEVPVVPSGPLPTPSGKEVKK